MTESSSPGAQPTAGQIEQMARDAVMGDSDIDWTDPANLGATAVQRAWFRKGVAAILALRPQEAQPAEAAQETDRDWSQAQDWKDMDGATAWVLINRHADGWGDTRAMMEAWRDANRERAALAEPSPVAQPVPDDLRNIRDTAPKRIWLDIGEPDLREIDSYRDKLFTDLDEVTWSEDNATGWGIAYVRADLAGQAPSAEREQG